LPELMELMGIEPMTLVNAILLASELRIHGSSTRMRRAKRNRGVRREWYPSGTPESPLRVRLP